MTIFGWKNMCASLYWEMIMVNSQFMFTEIFSFKNCWIFHSNWWMLYSKWWDLQFMFNELDSKYTPWKNDAVTPHTCWSVFWNRFGASFGAFLSVFSFSFSSRFLERFYNWNDWFFRLRALRSTKAAWYVVWQNDECEKYWCFLKWWFPTEQWWFLLKCYSFNRQSSTRTVILLDGGRFYCLGSTRARTSRRPARRSMICHRSWS